MNDIKATMRNHYEAFYLMTLSSAFLSSADFGDFRNDAKKVINFIRKAYGLDQKTADDFSALILGDMMKIGLASDYHALSSFDNLGKSDRENLIFYEIKGNVIEAVHRSNRRGYFHSNPRLNQDMKASMKYESFHHFYDAVVRFENIKLQAAYGDVPSTRELGLMYALGIGTKPDYEKAKLHLQRCMMWGDVPSTVLIREILREEKDEKGVEWYGSLYRLEKKYLEDGYMNVPDDEDADIELRNTYLCIALIKQYLIVQNKMVEIDIAFLSALLRPELSLKTKLNYTSRYKENIWKNAVCTIADTPHIGL